MTSAARPRLDRWWGLLLLAATGAACVAAVVIGHHDSDQVFRYGCAAVILAGTVFVIWRIDPAWTVSAALALTVFSGNWQNLGLPGFPFLPDRMLMAGGLLALLLRAPGAANRPRFQRRPVHWLLAFAAAYATIDAFASHTLTTNSGFFKLTDRFGVIPFLLFALAPLVFPTPRHRRILLGFLVATGLYLGLTALFDFLHWRSLVFPRYILNQNLGLAETNSQGQVVARARGPFLDAVSNGIALFDCGAAAAVAVVVFQRQWTRMLAAAACLVCLLGCLLTLQRTVWLAAVLATAVALLGTPRLRRYFIPAVGTAAVVVLAALALIPGLRHNASVRLNDKWTVYDRQNLTNAGLRMLRTRPLLGFGWDRFATRSEPYLLQSKDYPLTAAGRVIHNTFLSNAVELGVIGALIWLVALGLALIEPLRGRAPPTYRTSLLAIATFWVVASFLSPLTLAFPLTFLMLYAGVVQGTADEILARRSVPARGLPAGGRRLRRWPAQIPVHP